MFFAFEPILQKMYIFHKILIPTRLNSEINQITFKQLILLRINIQITGKYTNLNMLHLFATLEPKLETLVCVCVCVFSWSDSLPFSLECHKFESTGRMR